MSEIHLPQAESVEAKTSMAFARNILQVPKSEIDAQAKADQRKPRKKTA